MKIFLSLFIFLCLQLSHAQEYNLAKQYLNDGEFEKAVVYFEKLVKQNPYRSDYSEDLIACYQQLERYEDAEKILISKLESKKSHPVLIVDLGYNYTLQKEDSKATEMYEQALAVIPKNPNFAFSIGSRFQKYTLLDYSEIAFLSGMETNPELDFNFPLAKIYGEQGKIEEMYLAFINLLKNGSTSMASVLRSIDDFVTEDAQAENNIIFKKLLLKNAQRDPDTLWNELLSWLFVRQLQYKSAFTQEKAIYKRSEASSLARIQDLGKLALTHKDYETADAIFEFIISNSTNDAYKLNAELNRIDIQLLDANEQKLTQLESLFESMLEEYGYKNTTLQLQIAYANFLTFQKNNPEKAIVILKKSLGLPLNTYGKAYLKMALGDILVYDQKFNQALIYFSQIQQELKNDVVAQNARFKVAQTSFYKGDFEWALTQLKVLRSSTSQLIANDAMQLSLLISDNSLEDSTQTALKIYAKADLLAYQKKNKEAIATLELILKDHKGEKIEDEALLKQGQLLEKLNDFDRAKFNYQKIIEFYGNDILADDAYFAIAQLYENQFNNIEKAKESYEKIIYNYQDSYYFPQARKNFRRLRGDAIE
ncbi:tetratricopeptide repeat protein [Cellulophaga sp. Z1A5H]|uniref:tetratricopeptide repeat protein n=1 Tax=Cellulophaga sp. Z1A5H TaxID=2687291 RepID=UPI0013FDCDD5|nr:tetratricopeptide repeat protein [Cellulophaga sp. Z1A5H]